MGMASNGMEWHGEGWVSGLHTFRNKHMAVVVKPMGYHFGVAATHFSLF